MNKVVTILGLMLLTYSANAQVIPEEVLLKCSTEDKKIEVTITQLSNGSKEARVQTPYIGYLNPVTSDDTKDGERTILRTGADNGKELSIFSLKIPAVGLAHLSVLVIGNQTLTAEVNCDPSSQK